MKRFAKSFLVVLFALLFAFPVTTYAEISGEQVSDEWVDIELSQEEIDEILSLNSNDTAQPLATGLIMSYNIGVSKDGANIRIFAQTVGATVVVKSGFKKIVVQRRVNSSASWTNYKTYEDLYADRQSYTISKSLAVPAGYQYRVTCVHYAKKNILSTQTVNSISNVVTFS